MALMRGDFSASGVSLLGKRVSSFLWTSYIFLEILFRSLPYFPIPSTSGFYFLNCYFCLLWWEKWLFSTCNTYPPCILTHIWSTNFAITLVFPARDERGICLWIIIREMKEQIWTLLTTRPCFTSIYTLSLFMIWGFLVLFPSFETEFLTPVNVAPS